MQPLDVPLDDVHLPDYFCPDCGSTDCIGTDADAFLCLNCDHEWTADEPWGGVTEPPRCAGVLRFGATVELCNNPTTQHVYLGRYKQYDFCDRHYFYYLHKRYPEDEG